MPETDPVLARLLETAPVFAVLPLETRRQLAGKATAHSLARGETLAAHGEVWPAVLLVAEGTVKLVKGSEGGRLLAAVSLGQGECFWSHSLFDGGPLPASLEAEVPSRIYTLPGSAVLPIVRGRPELLWEVARVLVAQMRRAAEVIDGLAFHPLQRRLARLILERFARDDPGPSPRSLTLDDMAAYLGTTPEVVCRMLYRLADDGFIDITRSDFTVKDRKRLEGLASGKALT